MSAYMVAPKAFTVVSASQDSRAVAARANLDTPGLVWRSAGLSAVYATLRWDGSAIDTVALVGNNLRAGDTVRVRIGSTEAIVNGTSAPVDRTIAAWSGVAPVAGAITTLPLEATINGPFVRIDITATGLPAGYVEVARIVLGVRIQSDGVGVGAEQATEDTSTLEDGSGFTSDYQRVRSTWKVTIDNIKDVDWYGKWWPLLNSVGNSRAVLFVPFDDSQFYQVRSVFGRIVGQAKGAAKAVDFTILDVTIKSV